MKPEGVGGHGMGEGAEKILSMGMGIHVYGRYGHEHGGIKLHWSMGWVDPGF